MAKALSKAQLAAAIAEQNTITKKQAVEILDQIAQLAYKHAKDTFTLPGIGKLVLVNRKARTGRNPATGAPISVDGYLTMDCRLAYKPWSGVEIALVGQNLLKEEHQEFLSQEITTQPTLVGRSVYGKVTWQF